MIESTRPRLILLFNHSLTPFQETDARGFLGIDRIVVPHDELQRRWSQVPPEIDELTTWLTPLFAWLAQVARLGDYVLIQGEFGAVFHLKTGPDLRGLRLIHPHHLLNLHLHLKTGPDLRGLRLSVTHLP